MKVIKGKAEFCKCGDKAIIREAASGGHARCIRCGRQPKRDRGPEKREVASTIYGRHSRSMNDSHIKFN